MVAEKLRLVVLLLMLVMLLSKVREWKVVVVADLNADVGGVRLRWSAELASVRERIREADMAGLCSIFMQWTNKVIR
jgi:hypothetical protein